MEGEELSRFRELIRLRLAGEPVAYLVGEQEFWSLPLKVDRRVLIPRRDTETLVEVGLRVLRQGKGARVADVATGSGAVAIALAKEVQGATVVATDASAEALEVARANVERHGLTSRVALAQGDLLSPLLSSFDLIVSNPPYIPTGELSSLSAEVRCEPRQALDGGADGLELLSRLIPEAWEKLVSGGTLAVEHAHDQGPRVAERFRRAGFVDVVTTQDLAQVDRVTSGRR
jgi:release factor glutamine methyltransferase